MKTAAVVLAGGSGKRMGAEVPKQYLSLDGRPLVFYSLRAFEDSFIDTVVLVVTAGDEEYCRREIVERYDLHKVRAIVSGGKERYHSVAKGVEAVEEDVSWIFIHDGARPFLSREILERAFEDVKRSGASVAAVQSKDTVRLADAEGFVRETPPRAEVWQMQTPQVFSAELLRRACRRLSEEEASLAAQGIRITDDAMMVELLCGQRAHLVTGDYENIKITTPEDLEFAEMLLKRKKSALRSDP